MNDFFFLSERKITKVGSGKWKRENVVCIWMGRRVVFRYRKRKNWQGESLFQAVFFLREFKDFLSVEDQDTHGFKEFREIFIRVKVLVILDLHGHLLHGSIGILIPEPPWLIDLHHIPDRAQIHTHVHYPLCIWSLHVSANVRISTSHHAISSPYQGFGSSSIAP